MPTYSRYRVLLVACTLGAGALFAQETPARQLPPDIGTIIVAHGADAEWNAPVETLAASLGGPIRVAYLMGPRAATHSFAKAAAELEALGVTQIVAVPLLVSSHSSHFRQIEWLAGQRDSVDGAIASHVHHMHPASVRIPIHVTRALDDAEDLSQVLAERAIALTPTPREQALFLVAHGPNEADDYARWMENLRRVAAHVQQVTGFRDVRVDAVRDDAPAPVRAEAVRRVRELIEMQHTLTQRDVVVVPILISRGRITRSTLVADLAGLPIVYAGRPLLPHAQLSRWVEARVREAVRR
ncbi:MAG: CbiX/SirB N-terminal domain-containing protein [Gemmatimonadota bacterium]